MFYKNKFYTTFFVIWGSDEQNILDLGKKIKLKKSMKENFYSDIRKYR